ncbi:hypothetical protein OG21DRAFT_1521769 [Imleria badia]|nr:hypothetical protein OG21DRAFT_1521769 [Imleria badia]
MCQPPRSGTRAGAAGLLWYFGSSGHWRCTQDITYFVREVYILGTPRDDGPRTRVRVWTRLRLPDGTAAWGLALGRSPTSTSQDPTMRHLEHIKEDINTAFIPMHQRPRTSTGYEAGENVMYDDSWDPDPPNNRSFRDSSRFFRVPPASNSSFYGQQSESQSFLGFSNLLSLGRNDDPGSGKSRPPTALAGGPDTHPQTLPPLAAIFSATIPPPSTQQFPIPPQSTQYILPLPGVATFTNRPGTAPASYFSSKPAYNRGPRFVHQPESSPPVYGRSSELAAAAGATATATATACQLNAFEAADSPSATAGSYDSLFAFNLPPREPNSGIPGSSEYEYGTESRPQSRRLTILELCNDADADSTAAAAYQLNGFEAVDSSSSATAGFYDSPFACRPPPREPNSGIPRSSEYEYETESRPQSRHLTVLELCNDADADGGVRAFLPSAVGTASQPTTSSGLVSSASALALVDRTPLAGHALLPGTQPTAAPATSPSGTGPTAFAEKEAVVRAYQTISNVHSDLEAAQSALDDQKAAAVKANQTISNLRSLLKAARRNSEALLAKKRVEAETLKVDYDIKVSCFQRENSDLRSALDALKREVAEDQTRFSLGIGDFNRWMCESSVNADTIILDSVPLTSSSDAHHVLAHNALVNVRSEKWSSAYEDAEKSIVARPSAMGYIVKSLAQIGKGEPEVAMQVFDLAFGNCNPNESNLLLLIKLGNVTQQSLASMI